MTKNKAKHLLTFLFIGIFSFTSYAQDLSSKSISELETMKTEAVESSNFVLAEKIKNELKQRKAADISIAELEAKVEADIKAALAIEDYEKADQLQKKKIKINKLKQIDSEIKAAAAKEDYATAQTLKNEKIALTAELTGNKPPEKAAATTPATTQPAANSNPSAGVAENKQKVKKPAEKTPKTQTEQNSNSDESKLFSRKGSALSLGLAITNARFKDDDQNEKYDAGISYAIDWKFYRHLASFGDRAGINLYVPVGFIPYAFQKKELDVKYNLMYLSSGVGIKPYYKGAFVNLGFFIDLGVIGIQKVGDTNSNPFNNGGLRRLNTGMVYRLGYEIKRFEFFFEHRLGFANIEDVDSGVGQKTTISAILFGAGIKLGKRR
jgi:cell wall-associated NlpC family hydrolase